MEMTWREMFLSIDHTVTREVGNGIWTMLGLFLIIALARLVWQDIRHRPDWRLDRGTSLAIGVLVYFLGSIVRSAYIWLWFIYQNRGWDLTFVRENHWILIIACVLAIVGGVCMLRVSIFERHGKLAWIGVGVVSVALPVFIYVAL